MIGGFYLYRTVFHDCFVHIYAMCDLETSSYALDEYFLPTYVNFHVEMAAKHGVGEALGRALSQGFWALQAASPQL